MRSRRKVVSLARQLFKLSLDDGRVSPERVEAVLTWVEQHRPPESIAVLRAYKRLVEAELARHQAVIEFSGNVQPETFRQIAETMSQRYGRPIEPVPIARPELIAGLSVRVGCDIYENSVVQRLASLRDHT